MKNKSIIEHGLEGYVPCRDGDVRTLRLRLEDQGVL